MSSENSTSQSQCKFGTFQDEEGGINCKDSAVGHYVDVKGASKQLPCQPGSYQNGTGQRDCIDSTKGHYREGCAIWFNFQRNFSEN